MSESRETIEDKSFKTKWKSLLWDTLDKGPVERRFLLKLDIAMLGFGGLGFFTKFLDSANLTNAFVSGMKEDLGMYGNQLNYAITAYSIGFIIGEVPSNFLLTRVRPSIYISSCQIIWTFLTMCLALCKNTTQLYVLRFFVGLAEAGYYPGLNYMMGSWYRRDELAKRSSIFQASGSAAQLFSGFLMTAVTHLNGHGGLPGWKWLFIMDGVISFPVGVACFYFLPDSPDNSRSHYFSTEEIELAQRRMHLEERRQRQPFTWRKLKEVLTSWHIYLLSLFYVSLSGTSGTPIFPQYLKYHKNPKYTVSQINLYPSGVYAVQIASALVFAWVSDAGLRGDRWQVLFFGAIINVVVFASLAAWDIAEGWRWACYYLAGLHVGLSGVTFAWGNEICTDNTEERAIVLATMNAMVNVIGTWLPLIVWQQIDAPEYHKGFVTASCLGGVAVIIVPIMKILQDRETARRRKDTVHQVEQEAAAVNDGSFEHAKSHVA